MAQSDQAKAPSKALTRRTIFAAAAAIAGYGARPARAYYHGQNCFLKGTGIATLTGSRKIEDLCVGDIVPTAFGGARPIEWIGRFRRTRRDAGRPWDKHARPVRIARGALATNVPSADLFVTGGHALLIDGLLIPAESLINDTTISLYPAHEHDELEFFHIKLESHDVIYAEGAPCESLLRVDETLRSSPDHHGEAQDQHCAPIVDNGLRSEWSSGVRKLFLPSQRTRQLDLIRSRLNARAAALAERKPLEVAA
ncbi:Hint domain-containing protein [Bradyrhizobium commune]|uniref:Hint domain-containing protein n=1 Tax=Bradyrhizobium commune TaxID=83627 RepID=A0A7S9H205_9BRAD|nr:Hint domain-containing protein [Bradyrhizobium commune]QPF94530.1 Hint domain-containing protein [Bradyrhizobium commune]